MMFVPLSYKNKALLNTDEVHGGSPYGSNSFFIVYLFVSIKSESFIGAGTLAGIKGERRVSQLEHQIAHTQGLEFGKTVLKLTSIPK